MPPVTDDLDAMTDRELAVLEDELLTEAELDMSGAAQASLPRALIFVLSFVSMLAWSTLYQRTLPTEKLGPLNIPIYGVTLILAIATVQVGWKLLGRHVRQAIRFLLANWPVVLYLGWTLRQYLPGR